MPELDSISVHGFRSLRAVDALKLGPINVLIGGNGAGKSNFLAVFDLLQALREGHLQAYVAEAGGANRVLHFGAKRTRELTIGLSFRNEVNAYRIRLRLTETDELVPGVESTYYWHQEKYGDPGEFPVRPHGKEAGISDPLSTGVQGHVRARLASWRTYHFHDTGRGAALKQSAEIDDNRYLRADGANLPAFLYRLRKQHVAEYVQLRDTVRLVAPFFDDFILEPQVLKPDMIRLEWRHRNTEDYFDVSSLSDGTLRFIALATLFLQPVHLRPLVILVDEPELGLHPAAVTLLASLVKQSATATQVILATQSPVLLDHFEPEHALVTDLIDGQSRFTRPDASRLAAWLQDYSLGQLWEKNELGGRPGGAQPA